jgi:hypothetical protein
VCVMVRKNRPGFQLPIEIATNRQQAAVQDSQPLWASEIMGPKISPGSHKKGSAGTQLVHRRMRPRCRGFATHPWSRVKTDGSQCCKRKVWSAVAERSSDTALAAECGVRNSPGSMRQPGAYRVRWQSESASGDTALATSVARGWSSASDDVGAQKPKRRRRFALPPHSIGRGFTWRMGVELE